MRLDSLLVDRGLAASRQRARELIERGVVLVDGIPATKLSTQVATDRPVTLAEDDHPWVGRGALKLLGALAAFSVSPEGLTCADLGASTGGFTEVLLRQGARIVYAVDVGHNQLAWKLRTDPRVVVMEGVNARHLAAFPEPIDLLVGDLSFISLTLLLPVVHRLVRPGGAAVILVKPQFEVGRAAIAKGGRVRSDDDREAAIARVRTAATESGMILLGGVDSDVPGARAGNVEHFLHLARPHEP